MKKCCRCKENKEENAFSKAQKVCKACYAEWYAKKRSKICLECKSLCKGKRHIYCSNECKIIHNTNKIPGGCWEWKGKIHSSGYAVTKDYDNKNSNIQVHRLSYSIFKGKIPEGLCVCHSCDNRKCCNPKHLWLGTHKDNNQDCLKKGRNSGGQPPGEKNPASRLNEKQVKEIRELLKTKIDRSEIAKKYEISKQTVFDIQARRSWNHLD